jgi:hypothetical protein
MAQSCLRHRPLLREKHGLRTSALVAPMLTNLSIRGGAITTAAIGQCDRHAVAGKKRGVNFI